MANVTTLDRIYWPLMQAPTVKLNRCAVCGRTWPLNQHHVVWQSWGNLYRDGALVKKPTVTLCGDGNNLYGLDANGNRVTWCHGKAHHRLMHFRWVPAVPYESEQERRANPATIGGHLEVIEFDEPTKYQEALAADGWRPL